MEENNNNINNEQSETIENSDTIVAETTEEHKVEENKHICFENHCWKKCLAMVLAAFVGGFLAVYFVTDQIMERQFKKHHITRPNRYENRIIDNYDKIYEKNLREFERAFEHDKFDDDVLDMKMPDFDLPKIQMPILMTDGVKVKTELDDNEYKIKIGLKSFQGDFDKVNYNISGRKLTVFGSSEVNDNNYHENVAFSQDFILPHNSDITAVKKEREGNNVVITIPIKQ